MRWKLLLIFRLPASRWWWAVPRWGWLRWISLEQLRFRRSNWFRQVEGLGTCRKPKRRPPCRPKSELERVVDPEPKAAYRLSSCRMWPALQYQPLFGASPKRAGRITYSRVEEAARNAVEGPSCGGKGKSERQTDEQQLIQRGLGPRKRVGNLSTPKGKEKKENCSDKLAWHGNQMASCLSHARMLWRLFASLVLQVWMEAWLLASPSTAVWRASCAGTLRTTKWVVHCWCVEFERLIKNPTSGPKKREKKNWSWHSS